MLKLRTVLEFIRRQPRWRLAIGGGVLLLLIALMFSGGKKRSGAGATFAARQGNLEINVVEGGTVEALESQEIRCGFHGSTKILFIVEEGYLVTDADVANGKMLVELDSSELKQRMVQQDIQYQNSLAQLTDARQSYDIMLGQCRADLKAAQQKVRFARMDVEKFLGEQAAGEVLATVAEPEEVPMDNLEAVLEAAVASFTAEPPPKVVPLASGTNGVGVAIEALPGTTNAPSSNGPPVLLAAAGPGRELPVAVPLASPTTNREPIVVTGLETPPTTRSFNYAPPINFEKYADTNRLGDGSAKQTLRKMYDDLLVAKQDLSLAQISLEGTEELYKKDFVTKTEKDNEAVRVQKSLLSVLSSETALSLYIKYEFPKTAEEWYSKYEESVRLFDRAKKEAVSKLAQSKARLRSAEATYGIQREQRDEYAEQLTKCAIRAEKTGLVVYGGSGEGYMYGQEQIREGATVRERQSIITIPDMKQMSVRIKVPESNIKKVEKGLRAAVRVDAFADKPLDGEVVKVGVLPDSQNRWMNPDMKVYLTSISINGVHEWLKPGMGAKVEINVNVLTNVVYVPIQSVIPSKGQHVVYLPRRGEPERRVVEIGEFNDEFIQVRRGLKAGDPVLLRPPEGARDDETEMAEPKASPSTPATPDQGTAIPKPAISSPGPKSSPASSSSETRSRSPGPDGPVFPGERSPSGGRSSSGDRPSRDPSRSKGGRPPS